MLIPLLLLAACCGGGGGADTVYFRWSANSRSEPLRTSDVPVGDALLADDLRINRFRWSGSQITLNRAGTGGLSGWVADHGTWTLTITVDGDDVTFTVGTNGGVGNGFLRLNTTTAQRAILNGIDPGSAMRLRIEP